jgi:cellulose biosynthesis protein BcsQ
MGKKIAVFSIKGGEGKTAISLYLAQQLKYGLITNEIYSELDSVLPKERVLKIKHTDPFPDVPEDFDVIYDLRGSADKNVIEVLKTVDHVIIPITKTPEIRQSLATILEVRDHNDNIIIIANKLQKGDLAWIQSKAKNLIKGFNYPLFPMNFTKMFERLYTSKTSIDDYLDNAKNPLFEGKKNALAASWYKEPRKQFDEIMSYLALEAR